MKKMSILSVLLCFCAAVRADVKLIIEFDGKQHQIVRAEHFEANDFVQQLNARAGKTANTHAVLSYTNGSERVNIKLDDPRIKRAPMAKNGVTHEPVMLKKGVYIVTLKGDKIDLKSMALTFPEQKSPSKIEYAVIQ